MSEPTAVVVIVNWNGRQYLERCLAAVFDQCLDDCQVVLVDNGSTDGSREWVAAHFPQVHVLPLPPTFGHSPVIRTPVPAGEFIRWLDEAWARRRPLAREFR